MSRFYVKELFACCNSFVDDYERVDKELEDFSDDYFIRTSTYKKESKIDEVYESFSKYKNEKHQLEKEKEFLEKRLAHADILWTAMDSLQKKIISLRYHKDRTWEQISEVVGLTVLVVMDVHDDLVRRFQTIDQNTPLSEAIERYL